MFKSFLIVQFDPEIFLKFFYDPILIKAQIWESRKPQKTGCKKLPTTPLPLFDFERKAGKEEGIKIITFNQN